MTCIVGLVHKGVIYMGADSLGVDESDLSCVNRRDKKIFKKGKMLFGFSNSFRMGQILQYHFVIPRQRKQNTFAYMCTDFIDAMLSCFSDKGIQQTGNILIGYKSKIYKIDNDQHVALSAFDFDACGGGEPYALGSLYALQITNIDPKVKVQLALEAAASFSAGVRGPFNIETLKDRK